MPLLAAGAAAALVVVVVVSSRPFMGPKRKKICEMFWAVSQQQNTAAYIRNPFILGHACKQAPGKLPGQRFQAKGREGEGEAGFTETEDGAEATYFEIRLLNFNYTDKLPTLGKLQTCLPPLCCRKFVNGSSCIIYTTHIQECGRLIRMGWASVTAFISIRAFHPPTTLEIYSFVE